MAPAPGGHRSKRLISEATERVAKCRVRGRGDRLVACTTIPADGIRVRCRARHTRRSGGTHSVKVLYQPKQRPQPHHTNHYRTEQSTGPRRLGGLARAALQPNRSCQPSHAHGPCHRRCIISHCTRLEGRGYERFARVPSCSSARSSAPASFSTRMIVKYPRMHASM